MKCCHLLAISQNCREPWGWSGDQKLPSGLPVPPVQLRKVERTRKPSLCSGLDVDLTTVILSCINYWALAVPGAFHTFPTILYDAFTECTLLQAREPTKVTQLLSSTVETNSGRLAPDSVLQTPKPTFWFPTRWNVPDSPSLDLSPTPLFFLSSPGYHPLPPDSCFSASKSCPHAHFPLGEQNRVTPDITEPIFQWVLKIQVQSRAPRF